LRRIIAVVPATVGVFETGSGGIDDHGSLFSGGAGLGDASGSVWLGVQPCPDALDGSWLFPKPGRSFVPEPPAELGAPP
jgi:hypothetical protein